MNLLPVFGIGLLRIVQSTVNKKSSEYTSTFVRNLRFGVIFEFFAMLFSAAYLVISGVGGIDARLLICSLITGVGFVLELLTALAALRRAPLVLCTLCSLGGGIILPSVVGIFFFNEPLSILQWIGVVLFFVAAYFLSPKTQEKTGVSFVKAIPILAGNFVINGVICTVSKYYAVFAENPNPALYSCWSYATATILFGAILGFYCISKKQQKEAVPKKIVAFGSVLGVTCASIVFLTTLLSKYITVVIINTVPNAICIAGSLFVGYIFFKEKITPIRTIGALLSVVATILVIVVI